MKTVFDKESIVDNLPGIIILSHGPLAIAAIETIKMLAGEQKNLAAFTLEEGDDPEAYGREVFDALSRFPKSSLIFADLLGGTPSNILIAKCRQNNMIVWAIAGFNIPAILETVMMRGKLSGRELMNAALENNGVANITAFLEKHITPDNG
jgi:mannose/fructose-specific phosphotransferase system component IIA